MSEWLKRERKFKFYPRYSKLGITHLSFVDNLLLFARDDVPSVTHLQQCLHQFYKASGLQANQFKSFIYFGGVTRIVREEILQRLGYSRGELPVKYLGVPLSTKKMSLAQWQPLIEKMVARISSWTVNKLSYAGRIQLVQSVLFGIQAYWCYFLSQVKCWEVYCRSYVWSGVNVITRRSLVAWEKMCTPKSTRGLNCGCCCKESLGPCTQVG